MLILNWPLNYAKVQFWGQARKDRSGRLKFGNLETSIWVSEMEPPVKTTLILERPLSLLPTFWQLRIFKNWSILKVIFKLFFLTNVHYHVTYMWLLLCYTFLYFRVLLSGSGWPGNPDLPASALPMLNYRGHHHTQRNKNFLVIAQHNYQP